MAKIFKKKIKNNIFITYFHHPNISMDIWVGETLETFLGATFGNCKGTFCLLLGEFLTFLGPTFRHSKETFLTF